MLVNCSNRHGEKQVNNFKFWIFFLLWDPFTTSQVDFEKMVKKQWLVLGGFRVIRNCKVPQVILIPPGCRTSVPVKWLSLCHSFGILQPAFLKFEINYVVVGREVNWVLYWMWKRTYPPLLCGAGKCPKIPTASCELRAPKLTCENSWGGIPLPAQSSSIPADTRLLLWVHLSN